MPKAPNSAAHNQVFLKQGLIWIDVIGNQTGQSVEAMGREATNLIIQLRQANKPVLILDNVQKIGKADMAAVRAVAVLGRILDYDKVAMVGDGSSALRQGINLLLRTIAQPNTKYFADLQEAEAWLRSPVPRKNKS